ncbi:hypothetical protein ACPCG0_12635 [Propionibacteriaceae bacterium Y1923]
MPPTLSLAEVARLADVQRPVVSMWRRRPKAGLGFPSPLPDGRFDALEVVDWLEATKRGNNPDARGDLAIGTTLSSTADPELLAILRLLVATRALLNEPLAGLDPDDLLDEAEELDPDDEFFFTELDALDQPAFEDRATQADALADAAWHPRNAYEQLNDALSRSSATHDPRLASELVDLLAATATALLGPRATIVDVLGSCTDVTIAMVANEDLPTPDVTIASGAAARTTLLRYRVHGVTPRLVELGGDWALHAGNLVLARLPDHADSAFDLLDEVALQLPSGSHALLVGPAQLLTDPLTPALVGRRDAHLRSGLLRAAVRLPQGLTRGGTREHLALWLLSPTDEQLPLWAGDVSGREFSAALRQNLLDDLLAATAGNSRARAFLTLERADRGQVLARGTSLAESPNARPQESTHSPADDSARIQALRTMLNTKLPDVFPHEPVAVAPSTGYTMRLGDAVGQKAVTIQPGTRLVDLPSGSIRVWDVAAMTTGTRRTVDLLALTQAHPGLHLTEPGDVVFTSSGTPRAIVDVDGGSVVAYPARALRVVSERLVPSAIAGAINAVATGNSKWRTWELPVSNIDRAQADTIMQHLQDWETQLEQRQTQLHELRRLVTRSVLSGAITLTSTTEERGH